MFTMTLGSGIAIASGCLSIAAICCAGFLCLLFRQCWEWVAQQVRDERQAERKQNLPPMQPTNQHEWN